MCFFKKNFYIVKNYLLLLDCIHVLLVELISKSYSYVLITLFKKLKYFPIIEAIYLRILFRIKSSEVLIYAAP